MRFPKIFFDANSFYPPQADEKEAMDELRGVIDAIDDCVIEIPHSVKKELSKAPKWIQNLIGIYTLPVSLTNHEKATINEIFLLLFGKQPEKQNEKMDGIHIFEAQKYGCRYFVTVDKKHILSKRTEIESRFNLIVLKPSECLNELKLFL